jgi:hypothetical protein
MPDVGMHENDTTGGHAIDDFLIERIIVFVGRFTIYPFVRPGDDAHRSRAIIQVIQVDQSVQSVRFRKPRGTWQRVDSEMLMIWG